MNSVEFIHKAYLYRTNKITDPGFKSYRAFLDDAFQNFVNEDLELFGLSSDDLEIIIGYHLLKQEGKLSERTMSNYKASRVMLKNPERGRDALSEILKLKQGVLQMAKINVEKVEKNEKKAIKFTGKMRRVEIAKRLLLKKMTDKQIIEDIKKSFDVNVFTDSVVRNRRRLNKGKLASLGFKKPSEPIEEIGGSKKIKTVEKKTPIKNNKTAPEKKVKSFMASEEPEETEKPKLKTFEKIGK